jgi:hypothetical protein
MPVDSVVLVHLERPEWHKALRTRTRWAERKQRIEACREIDAGASWHTKLHQ